MLNSDKCPHCNREVPASYLPIHQQRCLKKPPEPNKYKRRQNSYSQRLEKEESQKGKRKEKMEGWHTQKFQCYLCGHMQTIDQLDQHFKVCPNKETECEHCGNKYPKNLLQEHEQICEELREEREQSSEEDNSDLEHVSSSEGDFSAFIDEFLENGDEDEDESEDELSSLSRSNYENNIIVMRFIDNIRQVRVGSRQFYEEMLFHLIVFHNQIRRVARQEGGSSRAAMSKEQIDLIPNQKYKINGTERDTCSICYVDFTHNEELKNFQCGHLFHIECIKQWLARNKHCPNCKRVMTGAKPCPKSKSYKHSKEQK